jgi:hypothetical protein
MSQATKAVGCWREEVSSLVEAGGTVFDAPISTETEVSVTPSLMRLRRGRLCLPPARAHGTDSPLCGQAATICAIRTALTAIPPRLPARKPAAPLRPVQIIATIFTPVGPLTVAS